MTASLLVSFGPKAVAALALLSLGALAARRRSPGLLVLFLALAGLALRLFAVAPAHRVFYDEYEHLDLARNLAERGRFAGTMASIPGLLTVDRLALWPPLAHLHYAALFLLKGFSEHSVYILNAVLSSLAVLAVGGPVAAAVIAFSSTAVMYAATADLASVALLWGALAWVAMLRTEDDASPLSLWAAALTVSAAMHARPDGFVLLPPLLVMLSKHGRKALPPALLASVSVLPLLVLAYVSRTAGQDAYGEAAAPILARLPRQAWENILHFLAPERLVLLGLAAGGFWAAKEKRGSWALVLGCSLYFLIYAAFANSAFSRGSGDKYALQLILPLALLAGSASFAGVPAVLALYAALGLSSITPPRDVGYAASDAFLRKLGPLLKEGPPVLTFVPPAPRAVGDASVVHPRLLLEQGPAKLDPDGKGFLLIRDEAAAFRPEDAAALDALVKGLYEEKVLLSETAGGRDRSLSHLTPRRMNANPRGDNR